MTDYRDFVRDIHSRTPIDCGIELRTIPGKPVLFALAALPDLPDIATTSYYFGAIPRKLADDSPADGTLVWCDTDGSTIDPADFDPKPTVIIHSGRVNGYHLYWRLDVAESPENLVRLAKLATLTFDGDPQVCNTRASLRLPFSANTKYTPPRTVQILMFDDEVEYSADTLASEFISSLVAPHYNSGERHALTMALAAVLARAGWELDRALACVERLYDKNPGSDLPGKLKNVRETYQRISMGEICATASLRTALTQEKYAKLLEALGITIRDGDLVIADERIGSVSNVERDVLAYIIETERWSGAVGKVVRWRDTHWEIQEDKAIIKDVFDILAEIRVVDQGELREYTPTARMATAIAGLLNGHCANNPLPKPEPHYLPLLNGTLNLKTLEIEPIQKERGHLWCVPVVYDPTATCPEWERFIEEAAPHPSVRDHLQEWLGYVLMAGNRWQRMLWLHGPSGTGKSTYIKAVEQLLGAAATAITTEKFSEYSLAQLAGKRAGTCSELSPRLLRTSTVKALVAGDAVQARHPYGRPFSVSFDGKLIWGSNELPPLDQGEGMWRRIVPVEFLHHPRWKDDELDAKVKSEAAGLLNWAIIGLRRLLDEIKRSGPWTLPSSVQATIETYRTASDPIISFAADEIEIIEGEHVPLIEVYQRYVSWKKDRGQYIGPLDPIFYQDLRKIGLVVDPTYHNGTGDTAVYLIGGRLKATIFGSFGKFGE